MDIDVLQARTTFLLQTIERSLGRFALARQQATTGGADFEANEISPGFFLDRVAESYLGDLFGLALEFTRGTAYHKEVLHLKVLAESLGIYEIRNACAHPNRPFFAHYWYRIASLAQDPAFVVIGLDEVREALGRAESDSFVSASDDWTIALNHAIPNNLPSPFEHERTGLLGREKVADDLTKLLVKGRFPTVALVAPGGLGKTALALEVLKKIAYSTRDVGAIQFVVFVSIKTQRLTAGGVEIFDSLPTIIDLEAKLITALRDTLEEDDDVDLSGLVDSYADNSILICIDNLENVLLGNASEFEDLLGRLPQAWRVLITTRIPINSAHCVTIGALTGSMGANLAMGYSRAVGMNLKRDIGEEIARVCKNNPLAIKITIDAIASGVGLERALSSVTSDTLRFSYDLLLEALSDDCLQLLELIFATGSITRSDASLILDLDAELVAESLGALSRTSLVYSTLGLGVERYSLNDSIRELLRLHPANLELRSKVSSKIANRRLHADHLRLESERRGNSQFSEYYVDPADPIVLREISHLVMRDKSEGLSDAFTKLNIIELDCRSVDTFWLLKGIALSKCRDPQAEGAIRQAIDIGGALRAKAYLGFWLSCNKRYPEAYDVYLEVKSDGGCSSRLVADSFAEKNIRGLLIAALFSGKYEDVLKLTTEFAKAGYQGDALIAARVSACRMLFHRDRDLEMLRECISTFEVGSRNCGYTAAIAKQGLKVINDLCYEANTRRLDAAASAIGAKFVVDHYNNIIRSVPVKMLQEEAWVASKLLPLATGIKDDELLRSGIFKIVGVDEIDGGKRKLASIPVAICDFTFPPTHSYRFASDRDGRRHYIKIDVFKGGGPEWLCLLPGRQIYIVPGSDCIGDRVPAALEASLAPIFASDVEVV